MRPSTDASMEQNSRVWTSIRVSHVCFDEYIDLARRRRNAGPVGEGGINDGAARQRVDCEDAGVEGAGRGACSKGKLDDNVRCEEVNADEKDGGEEAEAWHEGRSCAMAKVEALAREVDSQSVYMAGLSVTTGVAASPLAKSSLEEKNLNCSRGYASLHLVIADDNMHFRSMRHDVLRLARKCESSFHKGERLGFMARAALA